MKLKQVIAPIIAVGVIGVCGYQQHEINELQTENDTLHTYTENSAINDNIIKHVSKEDKLDDVDLSHEFSLGQRSEYFEGQVKKK